MKNPFRTRYRVVRDSYCGYEAQFRYWWMPFYLMVGMCNTSRTVEQAERLCSNGIVKQIQ